MIDNQQIMYQYNQYVESITAAKYEHKIFIMLKEFHYFFSALQYSIEGLD